MGILKQAQKASVVAFAPKGNYIAAGSVAGAVDLSFSSSPSLEIFGFDLSSRDLELKVQGQQQALNDPFHKLVWGPAPDPSAYSLGIIAGGLSDGSLCLWDPSAITGHAPGRSPIIYKGQKHQGAVTGLAFSPTQPNMLATGGADGDVIIWDVANAAAPTSYPPLKQPQMLPGQPAPEITCVAWNRSVQHIMASGTAAGATHVWDLKRQKTVLTLQDPAMRRRVSCLMWSPDSPTTLITASDDDRCPTLQVWDLRSGSSPVKEFVGHHKGVLAMDWCPHDSSLFLSVGKDNRTICWDFAADIVCEAQGGPHWNHDVRWSPDTPGLFASASIDGRVSLYNILSCTKAETTQIVNADFTTTTVTTGPAAPLRRCPAWLKRPAGAAFGFGGRLATFTNRRPGPGPDGQQLPASGQVHIHPVVTDLDIVSKSEAFEQALQGGGRPALHQYCQWRASQGGEEEAELWRFMSINLEGGARAHLLKLLGFEPKAQTPAAAAAPEPPTDDLGSLSLDGRPSAGIPASAQNSMDPLALGDGDGTSFFDSLGDENEQMAPTPKGGPTPTSSTDAAGGAAGAAAAAGLLSPRSEHGHPVHRASEHDHEIQRFIFTGDFEGAVAACLKVDRLADALVLASVGGPELFAATQKECVRRLPRPYMRLVDAIVGNDLSKEVKNRPVAEWKETLALICTYGQPEDWCRLCSELAGRLRTAGYRRPAILSYVVAGNVDEAVKIWEEDLVGKSVSDTDTLQAVVERGVVLSLVTGQGGVGAALGDLVQKYAAALSAQGRLPLALRFLDMLPGHGSEAAALLKDRIVQSGVSGVPPAAGNTFPLPVEDVRPAPLPEAPQPAAGGYGAAPGGYGAPQPSYGAPQAGGYGQPSNSYGGAPQASPYSGQPGYGAPQQPSYGAPPQPPAPNPYGPQPGAYGAPTPPAPSPYATNPYGAPPAAQPPANPYGAPAAPKPYAPPPPAPAPSYNAPPPQPTAFMPSAPAPPSQPYGGQQSVPQTLAGPQPSMFIPSAPVAAAKPAAPPVQPYAPSGPAASTPRGPGALFYPGMPGVMLPGAPPMGAPSAPPPPAAPPARKGPPPGITVETSDLGRIPGDLSGPARSLVGLYQSLLPLAAANPIKRKEMEDNSKKLAILLWRMGNGEVSPQLAARLRDLGAALDRSDMATANGIQHELTTTAWDENKDWLMATKRLFKTRETGH